MYLLKSKLIIADATKLNEAKKACEKQMAYLNVLYCPYHQLWFGPHEEGFFDCPQCQVDQVCYSYTDGKEIKMFTCQKCKKEGAGPGWTEPMVDNDFLLCPDCKLDDLKKEFQEAKKEYKKQQDVISEMLIIKCKCDFELKCEFDPGFSCCPSCGEKI